MILKRLGNKRRIAQKIIKYFPEHKIYIEPFFGAGGIFFNKPKAEYNILNDIDGDVFNLFQVILNRGDEFLKMLEITPYSSELFEHWKNNVETDPIKKAVRFVYLFSYSFYGAGYTMVLGVNNYKQTAINNYKKALDFLRDCNLQFTNFDFRKLLKSISLKNLNERKQTFIYCDPPYLVARNRYVHSFKEQDFIDLLDCLEAMNCKFAVSEFDSEFVLNQAKGRGLNIITIGERHNIKNRRTEILITNYTMQVGLLEPNTFTYQEV